MINWNPFPYGLFDIHIQYNFLCPALNIFLHLKAEFQVTQYKTFFFILKETQWCFIAWNTIGYHETDKFSDLFIGIDLPFIDS